MNESFGKTWKKMKNHLPGEGFEHHRSYLEHPTTEETIPCRDCERRRRRWVRHSVAIPWTIALALLAFCITLELSSARLRPCVPKDYWAATDFGEPPSSLVTEE